MAIYIPNMEMPKAGRIEATIQVHKDGTAIIALSPADDSIGNWREYPLVSVPEHGDLIDRDALLKGDGRYLVTLQKEAICVDEICRAPTIIPANPAKEG